VVGDDATGRELASLVEGFGVQVEFQFDKNLQTTEKLRMISQNQQLLRADFEKEPDDEVLSRCLGSYDELLPKADVVILSDYGKGGLRHVSDMIAKAKEKNIPVVLDPKGSDFSRYKGASLITPTFKLKEELGLSALLVTRSEKGMSLFIDDQHIHSPAQAREVYDVSGAGDTVISTIALALVSDMENKQRLELANAAAGVVVGKVGTATVTVDEIIDRLSEVK